MFAIYLMLIKLISEIDQKFNFPKHTVDDIMNFAVKKTSMSPLNIKLSDPDLQAVILSSKKTGCPSL